MSHLTHVVALNWWKSDSYPSSWLSWVSPNWIWDSSEGLVIWDVHQCPFVGWAQLWSQAPSHVQWGASHHPILAVLAAQTLWPQKAHIWLGKAFKNFIQGISLKTWHQTHQRIIGIFWPEYKNEWLWDPHILEVLGYQNLWDWHQNPLSWPQFQKFTGVTQKRVYDSWCAQAFAYPIRIQNQPEAHTHEWVYEQTENISDWNFWWLKAMEILNQVCGFLQENQLMTTELLWQAENTDNQIVWQHNLKAIEPTNQFAVWKALLQNHFRWDQPFCKLSCRVFHLKPNCAHHQNLFEWANDGYSKDSPEWEPLEVFLAHLKTQNEIFGFMDAPKEGHPLAHGELNPDAAFWHPRTRSRRLHEVQKSFLHYWKNHPTPPVIQWYNPPKIIDFDQWKNWRVDIRYREWYQNLHPERTSETRFYILALSPDHQWCWIFWDPKKQKLFLQAVWAQSPIETFHNHLKLSFNASRIQKLQNPQNLITRGQNP